MAPIEVFTTFKAVLVVVVILLPDPCTEMVPPPVAVNPIPKVQSISKPPFVKFIVDPVLVARVIALFDPVFIVLVVPANVTVPLVQLETLIPDDVVVEERIPLKVTEPPDRLCISINLPALFLLIAPV